MKKTYEAIRPLEPGKPVPIIERNEQGALVGAYLGYWNFKRQTVALYPDFKNRFVNWPDGRIPEKKLIVSDRYIKCNIQKAEKKINNISSEEIKGESWRERKLPMKGQERMDI